MMLQGTSQSRAMGQAREWAHVGDKGLAQQNFWHSRISGTAEFLAQHPATVAKGRLGKSCWKKGQAFLSVPSGSEWVTQLPEVGSRIPCGQNRLPPCAERLELMLCCNQSRSKGCPDLPSTGLEELWAGIQAPGKLGWKWQEHTGVGVSSVSSMGRGDSQDTDPHSPRHLHVSCHCLTCRTPHPNQHPSPTQCQPRNHESSQDSLRLLEPGSQLMDTNSKTKI